MNKHTHVVIVVFLAAILVLQLYLIAKVNRYQKTDLGTLTLNSENIDHLISTIYRLEDKVDAITEAVEGADKAVSPTE